MHFMRVKRLPVVNSGGQLVGIISRADVLAVFDRPDEDIRTDIIYAILRHEFFIDPRQFTVTVESGVVTMEGTPETAALGHALIRKARHVPGVVAVRDQLSYPDVYRSSQDPSSELCSSSAAGSRRESARPAAGRPTAR
jgi:CBS domain-containing protein